MEIAVISDTHDNTEGILEVLADLEYCGIDTVIHCGDMCYPETTGLFRNFRMYHACGNNDHDTEELTHAIQDCRPGSRSGEWIRCEYDGKILGAVHDMNSPEFRAMLETREYDFIFVGHKHIQSDKMMGTTRVINPGAIGGIFRAEHGYVILDTEKGSVIFRQID